MSALERTAELAFNIKINNTFLFQKSVTQLIDFCRELNAWCDGKDAVIEQLLLLVEENLNPNFKPDQSGQNQTFGTSIAAQDSSAFDNTRSVNTHGNASSNLNTTGLFLPKNLEPTLVALDDSFWYILNNPMCYNVLLFKFFDKNNIFVMFPYVESFFC